MAAPIKTLTTTEHTTLLYTTSHQFFFTHMYFGRKQKGCERSEKMIGVVKKRGIVVLYFFVARRSLALLPVSKARNFYIFRQCSYIVYIYQETFVSKNKIKINKHLIFCQSEKIDTKTIDMLL
jgi:hypothetical protein